MLTSVSMRFATSVCFGQALLIYLTLIVSERFLLLRHTKWQSSFLLKKLSQKKVDSIRYSEAELQGKLQSAVVLQNFLSKIFLTQLFLFRRPTIFL